MPQKQILSAEEKAKVIEDYINNRISLSEAARRGGVARDTISQWVRNYYDVQEPCVQSGA